MDVTPLSLGIETVGKQMSVIIKRNTPIPCEITKTYTTEHNYQESIDIPVFEGERTNVDGNNKLGEFTVSGIQRAKRGEPKVAVTFKLNSDGILNVRAVDEMTGAENAIRIANRGRVSDEDVERMVRDAERFAEEDKMRTWCSSANFSFHPCHFLVSSTRNITTRMLHSITGTEHMDAVHALEDLVFECGDMLSDITESDAKRMSRKQKVVVKALKETVAESRVWINRVRKGLVSSSNVSGLKQSLNTTQKIRKRLEGDYMSFKSAI